MEEISKNHKIKVLQVTIGDGSYGGVASFLYSYYSHMNHEKVHCDFLYCGENSLRAVEDSEVLRESRIVTLHVIKPRNNGLKEYFQLMIQLEKFFRNNCYDIVHVNTSNVMVSACIAHALHGKAVLIFHSHNTKAVLDNKRKIKNMIRDVLKNTVKNYNLKKADYYFACSKAAAENLFGNSVLNSDKFKIIHNAIELSSYVYDYAVREKFGITNKAIIGYVGRMTEQKNPFFLIDVFSHIHEINPKTELWMVGEGELSESIENRIKELELEKCIKLWGRRDDVARLMQAMDVLLLPSLYEGLSIVAIEAQAAGLPIYASDCISEEHRITDLVHFLPLSLGAAAWGRIIADNLKNKSQRRNMFSKMEVAGYEISAASKKLENFYLSVVK